VASGLNVKDRFVRWLVMAPLQPVAQGVWRIHGGLPDKIMNVYFIRDGSGVLAYDAGIRAMTRGIAAAATSLGGLTRVVLGHAHPDHRGGAAGLGVPVYCHPDEVANAEGDGGAHSWHLEQLDRRNRALFKPAVRFFDGGPVQIADTLSEDDEIAGFRVVHLPGHTPGQIGLWRRTDGLALVSDCFYTLDPFTHKSGPPRVPHCAFNHDTDEARASIRKLAALDLIAAWPGHAEPVTGDVRAQLEQAADESA
jgi:hydroxyacylglutathione hydrolase